MRRVTYLATLIGLALIMILLPLVALLCQEAEVKLYSEALRSREADQTIWSTNLNLEGYRSVSDHWSVWGFASASPSVRSDPKYLSGTIGPYYDLNDHMGCGVAVGAERFAIERNEAEQTFGRVALNCRVSAFKGSVFLDHYVENGASGEKWQRTQFLFPLLMIPVSFGVMGQTGIGTGPMVVYEAPKFLRLRAAPIMFGDGSKSLYSIELVFHRSGKE